MNPDYQFFSYLLAWLCSFVTPYIFQSPGYLGAKTSRKWDRYLLTRLSVPTVMQCCLSVIYAATTLIGIVWAFFYLPETNGRSESRDEEYRFPGRPTYHVFRLSAAQEIDLLFLNNVPARKWKQTDVSTLTRGDTA